VIPPPGEQVISPPGEQVISPPGEQVISPPVVDSDVAAQLAVAQNKIQQLTLDLNEAKVKLLAADKEIDKGKGEGSDKETDKGKDESKDKGKGPLPKVSVQNDSNNKITIRIEVPKNYTHDIADAGGDEFNSTISVLPKGLKLDTTGGGSRRRKNRKSKNRKTRRHH
jgi:hypothetical protein